MWRGAMTLCAAARPWKVRPRGGLGRARLAGLPTGDEPSAVVEIATWSRRSGETRAVSGRAGAAPALRRPGLANGSRAERCSFQ